LSVARQRNPSASPKGAENIIYPFIIIKVACFGIQPAFDYNRMKGKFMLIYSENHVLMVKNKLKEK
jgi:hypothetical protein